MTRCDIAVVGAGPAGLCAAIEAARAGASVTVVDEGEQPGGQIYRPVPAAFTVDESAALGRDYQRGQALRDDAQRLPITFEHGTLVWGSFERGVLELTRGDRATQLRADAIILATGAYDRPVPIPGWTLPGVFTIGGIQVLLKSQRLRPAGRVLLAGTGPLLIVVASQLAKAGVHIVGIAEPVPMRALVPHALSLLKGWPLLRDGMSYHATLRQAGVPWMAPSILTRIEGDERTDGRVRRATLARVDAEWQPIAGSEQTLDVDTVAVGYGLLPSVELARVCGCALRFDPQAQTWIPVRDAEFHTTVTGIYAVGDGAGVAGALVAADEGRIAGIAAARDLGRLDPRDATIRLTAPRARLSKLARFRAVMDDVYRIRPGLTALGTAETIVCRCEEVTREVIDLALADGAATTSQVRAWTRAGMGACQGRMCALPTACIVAGHRSQPLQDVAVYPPGPIVKPVRIDALIGAKGAGDVA